MTFWETVGVALWWLIRRVLAPLAVLTAVGMWRWLSGADLLRGGRRTGAGFMYASAVAWRPNPRFGVRVNWAYWPGWQRAVVRAVATGLFVAAVYAPMVTGISVTVVVVGTAAAAVVVRLRLRARSRPIVVKLITHGPRETWPAWSAPKAIADSAAVASPAGRRNSDVH